ncbi:MAG: DUF167 domain-containing protein [Pyrinomonadaceae bacterium]
MRALRPPAPDGDPTMIRCMEQDGALIFAVRVVPRASRTEVAGMYDGALRVRVTAPPVEGAANAELVRFVAKALGVASRDVEIVSGHSSKTKLLRVRGASRAAVEGLARG